MNHSAQGIYNPLLMINSKTCRTILQMIKFSFNIANENIAEPLAPVLF